MKKNEFFWIVLNFVSKNQPVQFGLLIDFLKPTEPERKYFNIFFILLYHS